ncbi:DMT family transporter [Fusobacterium necrophorum]|uniref:Membrane protein n=1 Tax=Fusobacterium necrophorum DJ-2 TaxID=1441737 RepID=A0AB73C2G4_9FUSO|nr:DMT family transporter [Fusobacterium necrophorum]KDE66879.1 membrane protein [Fusobacterium necrophorum DJ-1]KDE68638.1 membrane protein [Fusobacterium necrophorum DAB]KDE71769.1 membrane protein [Fusobacterium necrophorum DJ-2]KDE73973.1 membrane protein [Fusobacterium necrophorum BFTR-2]
MIYLVIASFLWGTSFIAGKIAYNMLDPSLVVAFRYVLASIILLPVTLSFMRQKREDFSRKDFFMLVLLGILTYPLTSMLQFLGLSFTSASSATTIIGIEPVMIAIIGFLFFKERTSPIVFLLGIVALFGVALTVGVSALENVSFFGCFLVFLSTIVVSFWVQLSKKILTKMSSNYYTALTIQLGTLFALPIMLFLVRNWEIHYSFEGILALLYLVVGCSIGAGWFWNKGLERSEASKSGLFLALEPVFGIILAVLILGEKLNFLSIIGIILVISSATVCMLLPKQES